LPATEMHGSLQELRQHIKSFIPNADLKAGDDLSPTVCHRLSVTGTVFHW